MSDEVSKEKELISVPIADPIYGLLSAGVPGETVFDKEEVVNALQLTDIEG